MVINGYQTLGTISGIFLAAGIGAAIDTSGITAYHLIAEIIFSSGGFGFLIGTIAGKD